MDDKRTAEHLSLLAATLDPALAAVNPSEAVTRAAALYDAALKYLDKDAPFENSMAELGRTLELFPIGQRVPLAEAFAALQEMPENKWKTLGGFTAALREHKLTILSNEGKTHDAVREFIKDPDPNSESSYFESVEQTSPQAIARLFTIAKARTNELDRIRKTKKRGTKGNFRENEADIKSVKADKKAKKADKNSPKAELRKQKADRSKSA